MVPPQGYALIGGSTDPELTRGIPVQWAWSLSGEWADQSGDLQLRRPDETIIDRVDIRLPEWPFERGLASSPWGPWGPDIEGRSVMAWCAYGGDCVTCESTIPGGCGSQSTRAAADFRLRGTDVRLEFAIKLDKLIGIEQCR